MTNPTPAQDGNARLLASTIAFTLHLEQCTDAACLKQAQENSAASLRQAQRYDAAELLHACESSAAVLRLCQHDAAIALQAAHDKNAAQVHEKNQIISWLSGDYSHQVE